VVVVGGDGRSAAQLVGLIVDRRGDLLEGVAVLTRVVGAEKKLTT